MQTQPQDDPQSQILLRLLAEQERIKENRVPGVKTILVVLSSRGMVYDRESLREKISDAYPGAAIHFMTSLDLPLGPAAPSSVDLIIDLTGPRQRQSSILLPRKLRRRARVTVGRNAGILRKYIYDRVFDEQARADLMESDVLERERVVQREVLALAGVPLSQRGTAPEDLSQSIALSLGRL